jgi:hypothetical protein
MDLDHWKQLDSLLQSVLERPLEERDAFLRHACAGDEPLERQVRALMSAEPAAKRFLERPAIDVVAAAIAGAPRATAKAAADAAESAQYEAAVAAQRSANSGRRATTTRFITLVRAGT